MQKFTDKFKGWSMSEMIPSERQQQIIAWLQTEKRLTIKQLVDRFNVSGMTVHRDLDRLAQEGKVIKVHGGAELVAQESGVGEGTAVCQLCGGHVMARTAFTVMRQDGEKLCACCPHCGILLMQQIEDIGSALTPDFLHGRRVNVYQAYFVVGSEVQVCCLPSTICFATQAEAGKFQRGFGGDVMNYIEAAAHLKDCHHGHGG